MLRRRQIMAMASIVVVAFLIGTMLNVNLLTIAKDEDDGRPVWETYVTGVDATALPDVWNVTVTNWPVSTPVNVWWHENAYWILSSPIYKANGFSQLHVLAYVEGLAPAETLTLMIYGAFWNATHTAHHEIQVAQSTLDGVHPAAHMTIPVPGGEFKFRTNSVYDCEFSMSFYLTWA